MRRSAVWLGGMRGICALVLLASVGSAQEALDKLPLSQIQFIGTHNSYHSAPDAFTADFLRKVVPQEATANDYSHVTLTQQLQQLGVRQLELDLFLDPEGKLYHSPAMLEVAKQQKANLPPFDPDGLLRQPGIKILHSPDFDFRTTAYTLAQALREVKAWSDQHRDHTPVFLQLELKAESFSPVTKPLAWDAAALAELEKEILAVLPEDRMLRPDDIRGTHPTLRAAVLQTGWPTLEQSRGKIVLLLDNEDRVRDQYLLTSKILAGRLLFVSVSREHPAAAWMKRNDPVGSFDEIQQLVKAGFLVRTRADSNTREARAGDESTRDKAFASGAQLISTDFPQADARFSNYAVRFEDDAMLRRNVVTP